MRDPRPCVCDAALSSPIMMEASFEALDFEIAVMISLLGRCNTGPPNAQSTRHLCTTEENVAQGNVSIFVSAPRRKLLHI